MKQQEEQHLHDVSELMTERRARPTALLPLWSAAGYCLGVGTALLGREAAMACTVAVETAIGQHYDDQIRELLHRGYDEEELTHVSWEWQICFHASNTLFELDSVRYRY